MNHSTNASSSTTSNLAGETEPNETVFLFVTGAKFPLGQIVATPAALALLEHQKFSSSALVNRHVRGDWGDLCDEDREGNEEALLIDNRLMSVYRLVDSQRIADTPFSKRDAFPTVWIITEWDRSVTTLLLPSDY
jgi:hypothetical protein